MHLQALFSGALQGPQDITNTSMSGWCAAGVKTSSLNAGPLQHINTMHREVGLKGALKHISPAEKKYQLTDH